MAIKQGSMVKVTNTLREDAKGVQAIFKHMMKLEGEIGIVEVPITDTMSTNTPLVCVGKFDYFLDESLVSVVSMYKEE